MVVFRGKWRFPLSRLISVLKLFCDGVVVRSLCEIVFIEINIYI